MKVTEVEEGKIFLFINTENSYLLELEAYRVTNEPGATTILLEALIQGECVGGFELKGNIKDSYIFKIEGYEYLGEL